ncbi:MAG TPA: hypothetical protein VFR37_06075, partial [Longimicrobium sp.]|nr:hypothetical protein [Longimicrobium sp.]
MMRIPKGRGFPVCLALGLAGGCAGVPRAAAPDGVLAIVGATVIASADAPPLPNGTVVIRDGRIARVGPADAVTVPRGATVVDARGRFVIPGLWD